MFKQIRLTVLPHVNRKKVSHSFDYIFIKRINVWGPGNYYYLMQAIQSIAK